MGSECCKCHSEKNAYTTNTSLISSNYGSYFSRTRNNHRFLSSDRFKPYYARNKSSLAIRQLNLNDTGNYSVECEDSYGTSRLASIDLNVEKRIPRVPIFVRRLHDVSAKIGSRARFLVEIDSVQPFKVTWYHDNQTLKKNDRLNFLEENHYFCLDVGWTMLQDEGHWTCIAENKHGCSVSSAYLTILVPKAYKAPQFVEDLKAILAEDGSVSLECKVTGVPTPSLLWYKDGKKMKAGDTFALRVESTQSSSLGTYSCVAKNCLGQAFSSSSLNFHKENVDTNSNSLFPLGPQPKFLRELRNVEAQIESPLTLTCQVVVPPWPKTIDWYNKSGRIVDNEKYKTLADGLGMYGLEVKSIEMVDDGEWKCVATSFFGIKAFSSCYVTVKFPRNYKTPKFLENLRAVMTPEGLVSFECKVIGYPTPQLKWLKDSKELKPGDVYQLTGTKSLGTYCCIAKNPMGEIRSTTVLTLEDIQSQLSEEEQLLIFATNQPPYFVKGLSSHEAKINEEFQFNIQVSGKPEPKILWYRNDESIEENERISINKESHGNYWLRFKYLEMSDQTEWKCVAVNDYGQSVTSCFVKLSIPRHFKSPRFLEKLKATLTIEGTVNLECKVIGVPQPVLRWFKDGRRLKSGEMHKIISGTDGKCCLGTYACEAVNCMGTAFSSASLLAFENEKENVKKNLQPDSLSVIIEERSSQLNNSTFINDKSTTYEEAAGVSFSFDGKEVSISLYETPDLTEDEALQIVEMFANELTEHISEKNIVELPSLRFVRETSTTSNILMEATLIDVPINDYGSEEELKTEADVENSMIDDSAFVTNNSPHSDDLSVDKNYSDFSHNIQQTSQSYLEDLSSEKGTEFKKAYKNICDNKNDISDFKLASETELKKNLLGTTSPLQKCKSVDSEDDSLYEFEKRKCRKLREESEESKINEKETREASEMMYNTDHPSIEKKSANMSVLESISRSINAIEYDLNQIRTDIIAHQVQQTSPNPHTIIIVESLLQPIVEIKKHLVFIEKQLSNQNDDKLGITTDEILQILSKPVVEFQQSLLDMGNSVAREMDESFAETSQSILDVVTPPLNDINRELNLIEEDLLQHAATHSVLEKLKQDSVSVHSDSQKMIIILEEYSKEFGDLAVLTHHKICSTESDLTLQNVYKKLKLSIDQMIQVQCRSLNLHKCINQDIKEYSTFHNDLQEFNCCLIHCLDTNIHMIKNILEADIDSSILNKFLDETIPQQEKLTTSLRVTENLSPIIAANYLCEALRNYTTCITEIISKCETRVSSLLIQNLESLKLAIDYIDLIINSLDTIEKCSKDEHIYYKKRLFVSLTKLQTPLQLCKTKLNVIEKQFEEKPCRLNEEEMYNIIQNISEPLQMLRKEISVLIGNYEQAKDLPEEIRQITKLLIPTLKNLQDNITTFHEIVFNQQAAEIDEFYILSALNNFTPYLCELSNQFLTVEENILQQTSIVRDPKLGIRMVMLSVSNLVDVVANLKTNSEENHSVEYVLCNLSEPLVEVKVCLKTINECFYIENLEKMNITMLKTLSQPFNLLQKRLIEAAEVVTGDLRYAITDLQRTILTIQDQVSFEYGDQPASIEYNIMTLQTLIQPINVLRKHCLLLQNPKSEQGVENLEATIDQLVAGQFQTIDQIKEVLMRIAASQIYLQSQPVLSKSIHSTCNMLNDYKNLLLCLKNAVFKNELTSDSTSCQIKTILNQIYSDHKEIEKSSPILSDILFQLQIVLKYLKNFEDNFSEDIHGFQNGLDSLTFLTPIYAKLFEIVTALAESDFQEEDSVKCFMALLQSLNTLRTLQENVKHFQSLSNTDSIQIPMLLSFLNSCERLEIKVSDLLFLIENFSNRKIVLDPQFYQRAIDAFSTLNSQLIQLNKCLIDQSISDDDHKEIPFESSINLFSSLCAIVATDSNNLSLKQMQLIIKEGILNELSRLKSDILFNMSLIQTDDEMSFNESDLLEENLNAANPDLFNVCTQSIRDDIKKCDKYFDKLYKVEIDQRDKYLNNINNSFENIFNIINFVNRNIPFENSSEHMTITALHKPVLQILQQIRQIRTAIETNKNDLIMGSKSQSDENKILILMNDLYQSFKYLKQQLVPIDEADGCSRRSINKTESSDDLIACFKNDSLSTDSIDFVTTKEKLDSIIIDQNSSTPDRPSFSETSSVTSDIFAENRPHKMIFENPTVNIIDVSGRKIPFSLQDSTSSENEESGQEFSYFGDNEITIAQPNFPEVVVIAQESGDELTEIRDFLEQESEDNSEIEFNKISLLDNTNLVDADEFEKLVEKLSDEEKLTECLVLGQETKAVNSSTEVDQNTNEKDEDQNNEPMETVSPRNSALQAQLSKLINETTKKLLNKDSLLNTSEQVECSTLQPVEQISNPSINSTNTDISIQVLEIDICEPAEALSPRSLTLETQLNRPINEITEKIFNKGSLLNDVEQIESSTLELVEKISLPSTDSTNSNIGIKVLETNICESVEALPLSNSALETQLNMPTNEITEKILSKDSLLNAEEQMEHSTLELVGKISPSSIDSTNCNISIEVLESNICESVKIPPPSNLALETQLNMPTNEITEKVFNKDSLLNAAEQMEHSTLESVGKISPPSIDSTNSNISIEVLESNICESVEAFPPSNLALETQLNMPTNEITEKILSKDSLLNAAEQMEHSTLESVGKISLPSTDSTNSNIGIKVLETNICESVEALPLSNSALETQLNMPTNEITEKILSKDSLLNAAEQMEHSTLESVGKISPSSIDSTKSYISIEVLESNICESVEEFPPSNLALETQLNMPTNEITEKVLNKDSLLNAAEQIEHSTLESVGKISRPSIESTNSNISINVLETDICEPVEALPLSNLALETQLNMPTNEITEKILSKDSNAAEQMEHSTLESVRKISPLSIDSTNSNISIEILETNICESVEALPPSNLALETQLNMPTNEITEKVFNKDSLLNAVEQMEHSTLESVEKISRPSIDYTNSNISINVLETDICEPVEALPLSNLALETQLNSPINEITENIINKNSLLNIGKQIQCSSLESVEKISLPSIDATNSTTSIKDFKADNSDICETGTINSKAEMDISDNSEENHYSDCRIVDNEFIELRSEEIHTNLINEGLLQNNIEIKNIENDPLQNAIVSRVEVQHDDNNLNNDITTPITSAISEAEESHFFANLISGKNYEEYLEKETSIMITTPLDQINNDVKMLPINIDICQKNKPEIKNIENTSSNLETNDNIGVEELDYCSAPEILSTLEEQTEEISLKIDTLNLEPMKLTGVPIEDFNYEHDEKIAVVSSNLEIISPDDITRQMQYSIENVELSPSQSLPRGNEETIFNNVESENILVHNVIKVNDESNKTEGGLTEISVLENQDSKYKYLHESDLFKITVEDKSRINDLELSVEILSSSCNNTADSVIKSTEIINNDEQDKGNKISVENKKEIININEYIKLPDIDSVNNLEIKQTSTESQNNLHLSANRPIDKFIEVDTIQEGNDNKEKDSNKFPTELNISEISDTIYSIQSKLNDEAVAITSVIEADQENFEKTKGNAASTLIKHTDEEIIQTDHSTKFEKCVEKSAYEDILDKYNNIKKLDDVKDEDQCKTAILPEELIDIPKNEFQMCECKPNLVLSTNIPECRSETQEIIESTEAICADDRYEEVNPKQLQNTNFVKSNIDQLNTNLDEEQSSCTDEIDIEIKTDKETEIQNEEEVSSDNITSSIGTNNEKLNLQMEELSQNNKCEEFLTQLVDSINNNTDTEDNSEEYWDSKESDCVPECSKNHTHNRIKHILSESISEQESFETALDDLESRSNDEISECETLSISNEDTGICKIDICEDIEDFVTSFGSKYPEMEIVVSVVDENRLEAQNFINKVEKNINKKNTPTNTEEQNTTDENLAIECYNNEYKNAELTKFEEISTGVTRQSNNIDQEYTTIYAEATEKMNVAMELQIPETSISFLSSSAKLEIDEQIKEISSELVEVPNELNCAYSDKAVIKHDTEVHNFEEDCQNTTIVQEEEKSEELASRNISIDTSENLDQNHLKSKDDTNIVEPVQDISEPKESLVILIKNECKLESDEEDEKLISDTDLASKLMNECKIEEIKIVSNISVEESDMNMKMDEETTSADISVLKEDVQCNTVSTEKEKNKEINSQDGINHNISQNNLFKNEVIIEELAKNEELILSYNLEKAQTAQIIQEIDVCHKNDQASEPKLIVSETILKPEEQTIVLGECIEKYTVNENCNDHFYQEANIPSNSNEKVMELVVETNGHAISSIKKNELVHTAHKETEVAVEKTLVENAKSEELNESEKSQENITITENPKLPENTSTERIISFILNESENKVDVMNAAIKADSENTIKLTSELHNEDNCSVTDEKNGNTTDFDANNDEQSFESSQKTFENLGEPSLCQEKVDKKLENNSLSIKEIITNERPADIKGDSILPECSTEPEHNNSLDTNDLMQTQHSAESSLVEPNAVSIIPVKDSGTIKDIYICHFEETEVGESDKEGGNIKIKDENKKNTDRYIEVSNISDETISINKAVENSQFSESREELTKINNVLDKDKLTNTDFIIPDNSCKSFNTEIDEDLQLDQEQLQTENKSQSLMLEEADKIEVSNSKSLSHEEECTPSNIKISGNKNEVSFVDHFSLELPNSSFRNEDNFDYLMEIVDTIPLPCEPIVECFEKINCIDIASIQQEPFYFNSAEESKLIDALKVDKKLNETNISNLENNSHMLDSEEFQESLQDETPSNIQENLKYSLVVDVENNLAEPLQKNTTEFKIDTGDICQEKKTEIFEENIHNSDSNEKTELFELEENIMNQSEMKLQGQNDSYLEESKKLDEETEIQMDKTENEECKIQSLVNEEMAQEAKKVESDVERKTLLQTEIFAEEKSLENIFLETSFFKPEKKNCETSQPKYSTEKSDMHSFRVVVCQEIPEVKLKTEYSISQEQSNIKKVKEEEMNFLEQKSEGEVEIIEDSSAVKLTSEEKNLTLFVREDDAQMKDIKTHIIHQATTAKDETDFFSVHFDKFPLSHEETVSAILSTHIDIDKSNNYEIISVNVIQNKDIAEIVCQKSEASNTSALSKDTESKSKTASMKQDNIDNETNSSENEFIKPKRKSKDEKKMKKTKEEIKLPEDRENVKLVEDLPAKESGATENNMISLHEKDKPIKYTEMEKSGDQLTNERISEKIAENVEKNLNEEQRKQDDSNMPNEERKPLPTSNKEDSADKEGKEKMNAFEPKDEKFSAEQSGEKSINQIDDDKVNGLGYNTQIEVLEIPDENQKDLKNIVEDLQTNSEKHFKHTEESCVSSSGKMEEPKPEKSECVETVININDDSVLPESELLKSNSIKDSNQKSDLPSRKSSVKTNSKKRNSRKGSKDTNSFKSEQTEVSKIVMPPEVNMSELSSTQDSPALFHQNQLLSVTENATITAATPVDRISSSKSSIMCSKEVHDLEIPRKISEKQKFKIGVTEFAENLYSGEPQKFTDDYEVYKTCIQNKYKLDDKLSFPLMENSFDLPIKPEIPEQNRSIFKDFTPTSYQNMYAEDSVGNRKILLSEEYCHHKQIKSNPVLHEDNQNYMIKINPRNLLAAHRQHRSLTPIRVPYKNEDFLYAQSSKYLRPSAYSCTSRSPSRDVSPSRFESCFGFDTDCKMNTYNRSKFRAFNDSDDLQLHYRRKPRDWWMMSRRNAGDLKIQDYCYEYCISKNQYSKNIPHLPLRHYPRWRKMSETDWEDRISHYQRTFRESEDICTKCVLNERCHSGLCWNRHTPLYHNYFYNSYIDTQPCHNHFSQSYLNCGLTPRVKTLYTDDNKVPVGATVTLHIEVEGTPKPNIEWIREGKTLLPFSSNYHHIEDADLYTLVISNISYNEAGKYKCTAWNRYGYVNASADVHVVAGGGLRGGKPPMFISRPETIMCVHSDSDVSVSFRLSGDPKPYVTWMKGLTDITISQRTLKETVNDYTRLTLKRAQLTDAGTYFIIAKNIYGSDRAFFTLRVNQRSRSLTPLPLPLYKNYMNCDERRSNIYADKIPGSISSEPFASDFGKNRLTLTWSKPEICGGSPILFYRVEGWLVGEDGGAKWTELSTTPATSVDLYNLKPGHKYNFRVTPRNQYGWGESRSTNSPITIEETPEFPEFEICLPGELKGLLGSSVELECKVKNDVGVEIRWFQDGTLLEENENRKFTFEKGRCFLKLINLQHTDSGRYVCEASNSQGTICTFTRLLVVEDPKLVQACHRLNRLRHENEGKIDMAPQFTMRLRNKRVEISFPIRLTCQVIGYPKPTVTWYKDGQLVKENQNYSIYEETDHFHSLEINHALAEYAGTYSAVASNPSGTVSCKCELTVDKGIKNYVIPKFIEKLEKVYTVSEESQLRIRAKVEAYPSVGISWKKNGIRLRPSRRIIATLSHEGEVELTIAQIKQIDSGVYTCTAANVVGQAETNTRIEVYPREEAGESGIPNADSLYSTVLKEPRFLVKPRSCEAIEDDHVIIECKIVGEPKPQITWLRDRLKLDYYRDYDEFKISTSDSDPFLYRLEIARVKFDHTGAYTIIAKNEVGEAKAIVSLQVYTKDTKKAVGMKSEKTKYSQVEKIPKIKRHLSDVTCCDGDSVTFEFEVDTEGDSSDINFHWYKNGKLIPLGEDFESNVRGNVASFVIKQVYPEDEGQYSCIVTNSLGTATSTACLIVNVPEEKENIIHRQMNRPSGTRSRSTTPLSYHRNPFPKENIMTEKYHQKHTAPKFYTMPHNKVAEIGDTVQFQCSVTGHPLPTTSWDKNNVPITSSARILVQEQNDLRILEISDVTRDDEGLYRIVVENDYGQVVATVRLDIINHRNRQRNGVATQSYEKHFGRHPVGKAANAGGTCAISCNTPNGSANSSASWYKNGEALNGKQNIVSKHSDIGFQLHFNNLSVDDSGVYTCILENCGGKTRCSAELIVMENNNSKNMDLQPPVFLSGLPRKSFVTEGKCFQFRVKLQGAFPMYVMWLKNDEKLPECSDFQYTDHGHGEFSLKLNDTFLADSGLYKCEAYNCHGDAVSIGYLIVSETTDYCDNTYAENSTLVINGQTDMADQKIRMKTTAQDQDSDFDVFRKESLNVVSINGNGSNFSHGSNSVHCNGDSSPATILEGPGDLIVLRGEKASLRVVYFGDPEPVVRWMKGGRELTKSNRISICSNGGESVLKINLVTADDGGKYEVIVENIYGTDMHCVSLAVEGSPDPPNGQPNSVAGDRSASVTWGSSPYDGGSKITGYTIEMRSYSNAQWRRVIENCHSLFCTVRGLQPGESYIFRIRAENIHGLSKPSAESIPTYITHADVSSPVEKKKVNIQNGELFANQYEVLEELGKGRYGIVHRTQDREFGNLYAAKFIRCIKSKDKDKVREEIAIMNALKHPKLLQLIAAYENPKEIIMVMEYISGGELFERVVADDFTLTERDCILFMRQICEGVAYIHKNNVVHLDLKPENIMCVSRTSHQIKLIDFGLAQKISPDTPVRVLFGTPEFIPPEIINYEPIGTETDMWSVGVICYVLLSGLSPFMGDNDAETFANITRADFDFDDEAFEAISKDAKDFISSLLIKRKEKRLTAKQCLHHKWLAQHDKTMSCVKLCTDKLKKFIIRRKWQKTGNAIRALGRMATLSAASRRNSSANSSSSSSPRVSVSGAYSSRMSSLGEDNSLLSEESRRNSTQSVDSPDKILNNPNSYTPSNSNSICNQIMRSPKANPKSVVFKETNSSDESFRENLLDDYDIKNNNILIPQSNNVDSNLSKISCDNMEKDQSSLSSSCSTSRLLSNVISKISNESTEILRDKLVLTDSTSSPKNCITPNSSFKVKSSVSKQPSKIFERMAPFDRLSETITSTSNTTSEKRSTTLAKDLPKTSTVSECTNVSKSTSGNSCVKFESDIKSNSNLKIKLPEKTNIFCKLSDTAKIKTSERLKKFEPVSSISSNCTPKTKKETLGSNKTNFQKAVAFWKRE